MDQKIKLALGAMCALLCGLCLANKAAGQALPDGKGKTEFVHNCTACHRADLVTHVKKTPDDWRKSVDDMAARGTDGTPADLDNVVLYLDTYFAKDTPGPAAATQSTTPSANAGGGAAPDSAEVERVKRMIAQNGCLTCHRIEQQGAYLAPSLNGVGARLTTEDVGNAIANPKPILDPNNKLIRVTTEDGTTIVARLMSQDDLQVRVMDATGEVTSYPKAGLQFTIVNANPMPSFEGRITGEDLDDLVRYLRSLPSVDDGAHK